MEDIVEADTVQLSNHRIKQVIRVRMTPSGEARVLRESGPQLLERMRILQQRRNAIEAQAQERVESERAEAVANGVHVVVDETMPQTFGDEVLPDVEGGRYN
jgi:hypothetical protein